jgi:16S rRNA G527 N7-methylase RsmG
MQDYGKRQQLIEVFLETNTKINLSAIRTPEGVYQKHILDSLEITKVFDFSE